MQRLKVNGEVHDLDIESDTPLLWVLREELGLTGTRFGCGKSLCGACTVHLDGVAVRSCITPVASVGDREVRTIESLGGEHPLQLAWQAENVPQCGYCQSGQLMSAVALLSQNPAPSDADIDAAMTGNICRCGTYGRIRRAIHRAAQSEVRTTATEADDATKVAIAKGEEPQ
ncbi:MAG: (2Fe-2S)-binding protein [Myxococcota bacterium]